jgi:hypothetical protein
MRLAAYRNELKVLGFDGEQAWTLVACAARDLPGLVVHAEYLAHAEPAMPIVWGSDTPEKLQGEAGNEAAQDAS